MIRFRCVTPWWLLFNANNTEEGNYRSAKCNFNKGEVFDGRDPNFQPPALMKYLRDSLAHFDPIYVALPEFEEKDFGARSSSCLHTNYLAPVSRSVVVLRRFSPFVLKDHASRCESHLLRFYFMYKRVSRRRKILHLTHEKDTLLLPLVIELFDCTKRFRLSLYHFVHRWFPTCRRFCHFSDICK